VKVNAKSSWRITPEDSMKAKCVYKFLVCAAVLCFSENIQAATTATVNFELLRGYLIVVPVTINGVGPVKFLLDTGTNTTLISLEFARQLQLCPQDRIELITVAGVQHLVRSQLESLTVGTQTATGLEVLISELREVLAI